MNSITVKPSSNTSISSYHKLFNFNPRANPFHRAVSYFSFSVFRKEPQKKHKLSTSCSKLPDNNTFNTFNRSSLPLNLVTFLTPVLQRVRNFTAKYTWVSSYLEDPAIDTIVTDQESKILHNGGIGMALLTMKSTAKDRFSPFIATLAANPTFMSGLLAWFLAQSIKVLLNFFVERKWDWRLLCSSGGMPSAHSALCTALTTSVALCHGAAGALFPVCLGFSLVVMYDAIGVRRHAGIQAEVLNKIIEDLFQGHPISERKLKELLGHTPSQVFAGAVLGIAVAFYCCQSCLVPI